jgi:hypothetical protein
VTPFPLTLVGSVCVVSVDDAQTMQIRRLFALGVNDAVVAYDVAFVVVLTWLCAVKARAMLAYESSTTRM